MKVLSSALILSHQNKSCCISTFWLKTFCLTGIFCLCQWKENSVHSRGVKLWKLRAFQSFSARKIFVMLRCFTSTSIGTLAGFIQHEVENSLLFLSSSWWEKFYVMFWECLKCIEWHGKAGTRERLKNA